MKDKEKTPNIIKKSFIFPGVNVNLETCDPSAADLCREYFDDYTQPACTVPFPTWAIRDRVCGLGQEPAYCADGTQREITILRREGENKKAMRQIRDLVMLTDVQRGMAIFKGGAVVNNRGKGIVLIGEEGAGKTSLILESMLAGESEYRFVTNSHVGVGMDGGRVIAHGYPMGIGVRMEPLCAMSIKESQSYRSLASAIKQESLGEDGRYYLDPSEIRPYFGGRVVAQAPVDAIVIVKNTPLGSGTVKRTIEPDKIRAWLEEYYTGHSTWDGNDLATTLGVNISAQVGSIDRILEKCPLHEIAYDITGGGVVELLDDL